MSATPEDWAARAAAGLGDGLPRARATALASALAQGRPAADAAREAGVDLRVALALDGAEPSDGAEAVASLAALVAASDLQARELRSLGAYPMVLLLAVLGAGAAVALLALPALALTPSEHTGLLVPAVGFATSILALVGMVAIGSGRVHVAPLDRGARARDGHLLTGGALRLRRVGVPLPAALRAAARLAGGRCERTAQGLAEALEAGRPAEVGEALLSRTSVRLLMASAGRGADIPALAALEAHHEGLMRVRIPEQVTRQRALALCAGGFAVMMVGVVYVTAYMGALGV